MQIGATDVVARYPGSNYEDLEAVCKKTQDFGLRLSVIERYLPHSKIVHNTVREGAIPVHLRELV